MESTNRNSKVLKYILPDESEVLAEDLVWKVLKKYVLSEISEDAQEDPDVKTAMLITRAVLESDEDRLISGMYMLNPEIASSLAALVYLGLKHKKVELSNNLTLVEETMGQDEVASDPTDSNNIN